MYPDQYPSLITVPVLSQIEMLPVSRSGVCDFGLSLCLRGLNGGRDHAESGLRGEGSAAEEQAALARGFRLTL